jgi:hypothetical protein
MACNCPGSARSRKLSKAATAKATRLANAGIKIKPAKPKKASPKRATAKKARPCRCT